MASTHVKKHIPTLHEITATARETVPGEVVQIVNGVPWKLKAKTAQIIRSGLLALEHAMDSFRAVEPDVSAACHAPTPEQVKTDPKIWVNNPFTDSDHPGYKPLRLLLAATDPALGLAEEFMKSVHGMSPTDLLASPDYRYAQGVITDWKRREGQAIGYMFAAFKIRVGVVTEPTGPDSTMTLVKDFAEVMRKRGEGKIKGLPATDVELAKHWYGFILAGLNNEHLFLEVAAGPSLAFARDALGEHPHAPAKGAAKSPLRAKVAAHAGDLEGPGRAS